MTELEYSEFLKGETDLEREAEILSLEHHGIKNQKWGVRRGPPYPIERGGRSASSRKKKKPSLLTKLKGGKKTAKKGSTSKDQTKKESKEQIRKKLLTSTDPEFIYKHRDLLTYQELQDRVNRINKERDLQKLIPDSKKNNKSALKQLEETMSSLGNIANSMQKAYTAYSIVSKGVVRDTEARKKKEEAAAKVQAEAKKPSSDKRGPKTKDVDSEKQKIDFSSDLDRLTKTLNTSGLSQDSIYAITKSYDAMANADKEAISKYQKNLLRRAEEERQKRKKSWH